MPDISRPPQQKQKRKLAVTVAIPKSQRPEQGEPIIEILNWRTNYMWETFLYIGQNPGCHVTNVSLTCQAEAS